MSEETQVDEVQEAVNRDPLLKFAAWCMTNPMLTLPRVPHGEDGLISIGEFTGFTTYRSGQFQAQMWICAPNSEIPDHAHPGVDVLQVYVWGDVYLRLNGKEVITKEFIEELDKPLAGNRDMSSNVLGRNLRIKPGMTHGATVGPRGGMFMTFQMWENGVPTSVDLAWDGEKLNAAHEARLKALDETQVN